MRPFLVILGLLLMTGCSRFEVNPELADSSIKAICEIVSHPNEFQGKEIRVRAVYCRTTETSAIGDQKCDWRTWVEFDSLARFNSKPNLVDQLLTMSDHGDQKVDVVFVGRFIGPRAPITQNGVVCKFGYGHLGGYEFEFIVSSVEKIGVPYSANR